MAMSDSSRKSAIMLMLKGKPDSDESGSDDEKPEDAGKDALVSALSDLKSALGSGDMEAAAEAFRDAVEICRE